MKIPRYLEEKIRRDFGKHKAIILYGARQVGKTTLAKEIMASEPKDRSAYYNCDLEDTRLLFEKHNLEHLGSLVRKYDLIVIDEAQRVRNIGLALKILIDNFSEKNFLITGSSSLELSQSVSEPLTGRFFSHTIFPIAFLELADAKNPAELREMLEERLVFGSYPEIITTPDRFDKQRIIENIAENYLFKDILSFGIVKNPEVLRKLLQAVALQLGNEVSLTEISKILEIDKNTVKRYLDLCEQVFVLFSLPPYASNKRSAISKMKKYYFYDIGIRNALIRNFNPLDMRSDIGALFENLMAVERMKRGASLDLFAHYYFYRSYAGHEIDLIEESQGKLSGYEFKYSKSAASKTAKKIFTLEMQGGPFELVNKDNFLNFVL